MTRVRALLEESVAALEHSQVAFGHGTANALDEAAWLLLHTLGIAYGALDDHLEDEVAPAKARAFRALVRKRIATRKPAAYLLSEAWLGPHRFYVDERTIVPRSFIFELLVGKRGQVAFPGQKSNLTPFSVLDLCTGSGCLAIVAALRFPRATVDAADVSADALAVAERNVKDYKLSRRVRLVQSDLFAALAGRRYDFILSNPPYVKAASMRALPREFRAEPKLALASGSDGLQHTRAILREARKHLNPRGLLMVEIGHNRKALERAYPELPFKWPKVGGGAGYVFTLTREDLGRRGKGVGRGRS